MNNKTVVIWDQCGTEPIQFFVVDRDLSHLDHIYVNTYTEKTVEGRKKAKLIAELNDLVYDKDGKVRVAMLDKFPIAAVQDGAVVIVAGFLP